MPGQDTDHEGLPTVTENDGMTPDPQMNLLGLIVAAGCALVMLPLVPFMLAAWLVDRLSGDSE
jgi:hypothetical protein